MGDNLLRSSFSSSSESDYEEHLRRGESASSLAGTRELVIVGGTVVGVVAICCGAKAVQNILRARSLLPSRPDPSNYQRLDSIEHQIHSEELTSSVFQNTTNPITIEQNESRDQAQVSWRLARQVKITLDKLFEGSPYSVDELPLYEAPLDDYVDRERMVAPIVKGTLGGHRFIAIKLDGYVTDDYVKTIFSVTHKETIDYFQKNPTERSLKKVLVLYQWGSDGPYPFLHEYFSEEKLPWNTGALRWDQLDKKTSYGPSFFDGPITSKKDGSGPIESQKNNFKNVQSLIRTGVAKDLNGLIWKIPETQRAVSSSKLD